MKTRIALNTDAKSICPTGDRFSELTRAAQAEGKTPDEPADEAIALLLRNRRADDLWRPGNPRPASVKPHRTS
jgi:hypothetical protein